MSRVQVDGDGKSMAFGVDSMLEPGATHTFVQVWDTSEEPDPCNEGEGGFNNILVAEQDVQEERVVALARQHNIPLEPTKVWETFD
jgi:hypothetical protein